MRHLDDGTLVGYRDNQLPDGECRATENHLKTCRDCRERLNLLVSEAQYVSRLLTTLGPGALDQPNPGRYAASCRRKQ